MTPAQQHRRGILYSLAATLVAAVFLVPYQAAVARADRTSVVAAMLASAALFNTVAAFFTDRTEGARFDRVAIGTALFLGTSTIIGNTALAFALPLIGPGVTSVVMKAQVLVTPLLSLWFLKERASARLWAGGGLAMLGFALPHLLERGHAGALEGYLWTFGAACVFAAMQVLSRGVVHRIPIAPVNALRLWLAAGVLFAWPTELGGAHLDALDGTTWALAGVAGALGPGISRLFLMYAVRYVTASLTALVSLVGPVFAFGLGYLAFSEVPTVWEGLGSVLILAGVLWPLAPGLARTRPS